MTEEVLPSSAVGGTTETAGFFECGAAALVDWLVAGLGDEWPAHPTGPDSVAPLLHMILAGGQGSKYLVLDMSGWAVDGSRWRFEEFGARLPSEDTDRHAERKVRDRFPPALVRRYLGELGAPQVSLGAEATGFLVERT